MSKIEHSLPLVTMSLVTWVAACVGARDVGVSPVQEPARPPNILLILADDLGYADVGFNGCEDIPTPNIDSLAKNGVQCTSGYVSCPVCSPMRAGLMTGRYQQRFGYEFNPGPTDKASLEFGLPLDEVTLPQQLKKIGYVTGMVGKWHLGLKKELHPNNRGFDEFFGFPHGSHSYFAGARKADPRNPIMRGLEEVDEQEYLTSAFSREAVRFIEQHGNKPFFLYLSYNAVHTPMQAPPESLDRFPSIKNKKRRTYAAMLSAMDDGVGQVLAKLRELGLQRDTLVFFLSDNGGPPKANASRNDPLRGAKGSVYEGGTRVPFVMQWKGHLPEGRIYEQPVISLDIFPTVLAAATQQPIPDLKLDGVNLLPYLSGTRKQPPHEALYWRFGSRCAIRRNNMKMVWDARRPRGRQGRPPWELYDLSSDIGETQDLASEKPEVVTSLKELYASWDSELSKPRWEPVQRAKKGKRAKKRTPQ